MKIVYENPWFKVECENGFHYIVEDASKNGAVILAEEDNKKLIFINIYRPVHKKLLIELPRGYGNNGETSLECALRELKEETGYSVKKENCSLLGFVQPNSAILASEISIFLAKVSKLDRGKPLDKEAKEILRFSIDEIREMLSQGKITDGFTLSALSYYFSKILLKKGTGADLTIDI